MTRPDVRADYFEWLFNLVCKDRYSDRISFRKLLQYLHNVEFTYSIPKDSNRAADGVDLRYRFTSRQCLWGPCSVLEMMIALAIRCEEDTMNDPRYGDRTAQWFWGMINSMELGGMTDANFDEEYVANSVNRLLKRQYAPNGKGGLFTIRNCQYDLRNVEIWHQLCYYLDTLI